MNVEKAKLCDTDALVQLRLDFLCEDNGGLDERDTATIRKNLPAYFLDHMDRDLFIYVIRDGQAIVSCAFLLIVEKPMSPAFINGKTGIVLNVYTRPSARRKGYAEAIMKTLLEEAREKELAAVELKSTEAGYSLYRSVGFTDDCSRYHAMKWKNPDSLN